MLGKIEGKRRRDDIGWDGWMASLTQWTWVWANSGRFWRTGKCGTGKCGVLQSMGSQRVGHNWVTEQQQWINRWMKEYVHRLLCLHTQSFPTNNLVKGVETTVESWRMARHSLDGKVWGSKFREREADGLGYSLLSEGDILGFCVLNARVHITSSLVTHRSDATHSCGVINCQCKAQSDPC